MQDQHPVFSQLIGDGDVSTKMKQKASKITALKTALEEYQALEKKVDLNGDQQLSVRARMMELWPLVQVECRQNQIDQAKAFSSVYDQQLAIEILKELARKWKEPATQRLGFKELEEVFGRKEFECPNREGRAIKYAPSLLERLRLLASSDDHRMIWGDIQEAISKALAIDKPEAFAEAAKAIDLLLNEFALTSGIAPPKQLESFEIHCISNPITKKYTHKDRAKAYLIDHPEDDRDLEQVITASKNYNYKVNRKKSR
jgi:hypothetical protein